MKAIVTGGSSGIGLAIAMALAEEGASVFIIARDRNRLDDSVSKVKGCIALEADVTDLGSLRAAARSKGIGGKIDLLINSAGISHPGRFLETDHGHIERTIRTNLMGTMNSCYTFAPLLKEGGHIVNIGSIAGIIGLYGYGAYSASKFGIMGFSEALRMEMMEKGIGVSVVLPPDTRTPQLEYEEKLKPPQTKRLTKIVEARSPEWVASEVLEAIRRRRFIAVLTMKGKWVHMATRYFPSLTRWYIDRKIWA